MARKQSPPPPPVKSPRRARRVIIPEAGIDVDLKDPWLAAFLAWLVPGLGHLYQGRTAKGLLFLICILGTFFFGLYLGDGHVVYASLPQQQPYRWQYWCQVGAGLPALPAMVQRERAKGGKTPLWGGLMAPPRDSGPGVPPEAFESLDESGNRVVQPTELAKWNHDLPSNFELGTVYTMIAGLLNVLVIYDAAAGPLVILHEPRKKKKRRGADADEQPLLEVPAAETAAPSTERDR